MSAGISPAYNAFGLAASARSVAASAGLRIACRPPWARHRTRRNRPPQRDRSSNTFRRPAACSSAVTWESPHRPGGWQVRTVAPRAVFRTACARLRAFLPRQACRPSVHRRPRHKTAWPCHPVAKTASHRPPSARSRARHRRSLCDRPSASETRHRQRPSFAARPASKPSGSQSPRRPRCLRRAKFRGPPRLQADWPKPPYVCWR